MNCLGTNRKRRTWQIPSSPFAIHAVGGAASRYLLRVARSPTDQPELSDIARYRVRHHAEPYWSPFPANEGGGSLVFSAVEYCSTGLDQSAPFHISPCSPYSFNINSSLGSLGSGVVHVKRPIKQLSGAQTSSRILKVLLNFSSKPTSSTYPYPDSTCINQTQLLTQKLISPNPTWEPTISKTGSRRVSMKSYHGPQRRSVLLSASWTGA